MLGRKCPLLAAQKWMLSQQEVGVISPAQRSFVTYTPLGILRAPEGRHNPRTRLNKGPNMKCPHCKSLCASSDVVCLACRAPLQSSSKPSDSGFSARIPMIFAMLGVMCASVIYPSYHRTRGIDFERVSMAGFAAVAGGVVGMVLVWLFGLSSKRSE